MPLRAAFEPLPPDLNVDELVESTPNFEYAPRIPYESIEEQGLEMFERLVMLHVVMGGKPLVVEGMEQLLDSSVFSETWLRQYHSSKKETVCDLTNKTTFDLTIGHYLNNMQLLANQWDARNHTNLDVQRLYLKDIDCPDLWHEHLKEVIPASIFYLNEARHKSGHSGASNASSRKSNARNDQTQLTIAGDLMSCLPKEMRAENLMCYIGHEGTYTPCHREMCGSLGQNLMVEATTGSIEHGQPTKPGSSIWFMTENKDRGDVSEYWMSTLGHEIEIEDHFAQLNAWSAAPFKTYVVEQRPGDLILIPPLAPHQVWNRGTRTMKVAWNRTTVETLELALNEALPRSRMVCRDEQYKNKAIVYYGLQEYSKRVNAADERQLDGPEIRQLWRDFERLFALYTQILVSESFSDTMPEKKVDFIPFDSNIVCSYCRCNIFNRFLTCPWCAKSTDQGVELGPYDICMECYAMGRSCACISKLTWVEQFRWSELADKHEKWRLQILKFTKSSHDRTLSLTDSLRQFGRKTLAEICQEQLRQRPWVDITKPLSRRKLNNDLELTDVGRARKRRRLHRGKASVTRHPHCHVCNYHGPLWKLAACSYCDTYYCYGSLFRAFNLHPHEVLEQLDWKCPRCQKICNCAVCRKNPIMDPYEPITATLGHDTKKIADSRSVESLVDFSQSNIRWLQKIPRKQLYKQTATMKSQEDQLPFHIHLVGSETDDQLSEPANSCNQDKATEIPVDPALALNAPEVVKEIT